MHPILGIVFLLLVAVTSPTLGLGQESSAQRSSEEAEVLKTEEAFRVAKFQGDAAALSQILADEVINVNQYGSRRSKKQVLELFRNFKLSSLTPIESEVRISGGVAIVVGTQMEANPTGNDKIAFTRVYIRRDGRGQIVASTRLLPQPLR